MRYSNLGLLPQKEANYRDLEGTDLKPCPPRGEWRPQDEYLGRGRGANDSTILVFKYKGLGGGPGFVLSQRPWRESQGTDLGLMQRKLETTTVQQSSGPPGVKGLQERLEGWCQFLHCWGVEGLLHPLHVWKLTKIQGSKQTLRTVGPSLYPPWGSTGGGGPLVNVKVIGMVRVSMNDPKNVQNDVFSLELTAFFPYSVLLLGSWCKEKSTPTLK